VPIKVTQLLGEAVTFDWPYAGDIMQVTYNPQNVTPALEGRIEEISKTQFQAKAIVELLFGSSTDEDVPGLLVDLKGIVEADGTNIEVSPERFAKLPIQFLNDLLEAISGHAQPGSEEGKVSDAT